MVLFPTPDGPLMTTSIGLGKVIFLVGAASGGA